MAEPLNTEDVRRVQEAKRWWAWLARGWRWWLLAGSVTVPLPFIEWIWGYDFAGSNKIHTAFLQVLGVVFFLVGIKDSLKRFKKPGAFERLLGWVKEFPLIKPPPVTASVNVSLGPFTLAVTGGGLMS